MGLPWRRLTRSFHRDLGYLGAGLTLIYALSGILLNHLHDWNSNYRFEKVSLRLTPWTYPAAFSERDLPDLLKRIGEEEKPRGTFRPDPETVRIFMDQGRVISVNLRTGVVEGELPRKRPLLFRMNALHLNRYGRVWTWLADLYAAALALLALTGLFILGGRQGLRGRGGWLAAAGLLLTLLAALLLGSA